MALVPATGLWEKESKNGKTFWSGKIREDIPAGSRIMMFENDKADSDDDPVYNLSYADDEDEDDRPRKSSSRNGRKRRTSRRDED